MQMDPFTHILGTQTAQKRHFLAIFDRFSNGGPPLANPVAGRHRRVSRSNFVRLYFTFTGIMHRNFNQIQNTTTEF